MPSVAPLSAAQLHEPILPLARPPLLVLEPDRPSATRSIGSALGDASTIHYLYVVDDEQTLVGVVPARRLLTAEPEQVVRDVMIDNVVAIPDWATVLIASEYFATRRLLAFPVVNAAGQLVGVVDVSLFTDEVIDLAKQTYDDIFQLIGVHGTAQRSHVDGVSRSLSVAALQHRRRPAGARSSPAASSTCCRKWSCWRCSSRSCWRSARASACRR